MDINAERLAAMSSFVGKGNSIAAKDSSEHARALLKSPTIKKSAAIDKPAQRKSKWSWTIVNFWFDFALLINFLTLVWVSTVIRFVFPPATVSQGWRLWELDMNAWLGLQFALIASLSLGIFVHLMLHWSWVCGVFFSRVWSRKGQTVFPDDGTRTIYGVGLMIVLLNLLGLLIAIAALSIESPF